MEEEGRLRTPTVPTRMHRHPPIGLWKATNRQYQQHQPTASMPPQLRVGDFRVEAAAVGLCRASAGVVGLFQMVIVVEEVLREVDLGDGAGDRLLPRCRRDPRKLIILGAHATALISYDRSVPRLHCYNKITCFIVVAKILLGTNILGNFPESGSTKASSRVEGSDMQ